jgi:hypothetical protein
MRRSRQRLRKAFKRSMRTRLPLRRRNLLPTRAAPMKLAMPRQQPRNRPGCM